MNTGLHSPCVCARVMVPARLLSSLRGRGTSSSSYRLATALSAAGGGSGAGDSDAASSPSHGSRLDSSSAAGAHGTSSPQPQPVPRRRKGATSGRQQQGGGGPAAAAGIAGGAAAYGSRHRPGRRELMPYSPRFEGPSYSTSAANMESGVVHGAKVVGAALLQLEGAAGDVPGWDVQGRLPVLQRGPCGAPWSVLTRLGLGVPCTEAYGGPQTGSACRPALLSAGGGPGCIGRSRHAHARPPHPCGRNRTPGVGGQPEHAQAAAAVQPGVGGGAPLVRRRSQFRQHAVDAIRPLPRPLLRSPEAPGHAAACIVVQRPGRRNTQGRGAV